MRVTVVTAFELPATLTLNAEAPGIAVARSCEKLTVITFPAAVTNADAKAGTKEAVFVTVMLLKDWASTPLVPWTARLVAEALSAAGAA